MASKGTRKYGRNIKKYGDKKSAGRKPHGRNSGTLKQSAIQRAGSFQPPTVYVVFESGVEILRTGNQFEAIKRALVGNGRKVVTL